MGVLTINKIIAALLIVMIAMVSSKSYSAGGVESLSPELRELLKQEMLALQEGMKNIVPAFASGDLGKVSEIAGKMNKSFIDA